MKKSSGLYKLGFLAYTISVVCWSFGGPTKRAFGFNDMAFPTTDGHNFRVRYAYPSFGLTITKASPDEVDYMCADTPVLDDGRKPDSETHYLGCTVTYRFPHKHSDIYVRWTSDGAKAIVHELSHADGKPRDLVNEIDWDKPTVPENVGP